jgi:hypothetical protein
MSAKKSIDLKQLRADLDTLSTQDFEFKYPGLSTKSLRGLSMDELEQRISKIQFKTGGVGGGGTSF